jgi:hypothetical protein
VEERVSKVKNELGEKVKDGFRQREEVIDKLKKENTLLKRSIEDMKQ